MRVNGAILKMDGMNKKWCGSCQAARDADGFKLIETSSKIKRWKCAFCIARQSEQKYRSKKNATR